jgi:hypothetical protein
MIDLTGYKLVLDANHIVVECVPPKRLEQYDVMGQRDPQWSGHLLGNSATSTIGGYGCLVTCMAILAGCRPDRMNDGLRASGGFQSEPRGGYMAYAGFTTALEKASAIYGKRRVTFSFMSQKIQAASIKPAGWLQKLTDWMAAGRPAIIEVDMNIKTTAQEQHFVVGLPGSTARSVEIIDPWDKVGTEYGKRQPLLPEYGDKLENAVWRYILYEVT